MDYKCITLNCGYYSTAKSSFLQKILIKEFGDDIVFHERSQKNVSELVYDTRAADLYLEAAISSLGQARVSIIALLVSLRGNCRHLEETYQLVKSLCETIKC